MPIFDEAAAVEAMARAIYGGDDARWQRNQKTQGVFYAQHQAKRALAALKPFLGEWRTMESAPKDGTVVLLAHAGRTLAGYYAMAQAAMMVEADRRYPWEFLDSTNGTNAIANPTHWMPLPPSPDKGGE